MAKAKAQITERQRLTRQKVGKDANTLCPKGTRSPKVIGRMTDEARKALEQAGVIAWGEGEFEGDSYDLLSKVYKCPAMPMRMRISAAEVCIRYERPMLQAVAFVGDINDPSNVGRQMMDILNGTGRGLPSRDLPDRTIEGSAEDISESVLASE